MKTLEILAAAGHEPEQTASKRPAKDSG